MFFLDTNVLVYSRDADSPSKNNVATKLVDEFSGIGEAVISTQVLCEFLWVVTRKLRQRMSLADAVADVARFQNMFRLVSVSVEVFDLAMEILQTHQITVWDAQIVAAASLSGASVLLTEDAQSQPIIHGVRFANPFEPGFDWRHLPT